MKIAPTVFLALGIALQSNAAELGTFAITSGSFEGADAPPLTAMVGSLEVSAGYAGIELDLSLVDPDFQLVRYSAAVPVFDGGDNLHELAPNNTYDGTMSFWGSWPGEVSHHEDLEGLVMTSLACTLATCQASFVDSTHAFGINWSQTADFTIAPSLPEPTVTHYLLAISAAVLILRYNQTAPAQPLAPRPAPA